MRACSSTPPKQNQDFVKEQNRTPLSKANIFVNQNKTEIKQTLNQNLKNGNY